MKPPSFNRYEQIILASAKLFRERGYLATSIRDIGEALGITSAALYYHFKNKDELLLAVMEQALLRLREAVIEAISTSDNSAERLRIAIRTHLRISTDYQDFAIVWLRETRNLTPTAYEQVKVWQDAYDAVWSGLFLAAQKEGLYKEGVDIRLMRLLMFGALNLVVTWYRQKSAYSPEQIAHTLYYYVSEGVHQTPLGLSFTDIVSFP